MDASYPYNCRSRCVHGRAKRAGAALPALSEFCDAMAGHQSAIKILQTVGLPRRQRSMACGQRFEKNLDTLFHVYGLRQGALEQQQCRTRRHKRLDCQANRPDNLTSLIWIGEEAIMQGSQWRLQDAKTQFSQVVDAALQESRNTLHGEVGRRWLFCLRQLSRFTRVLEASAPGFVAHLLAIPKDEGTTCGTPSYCSARHRSLMFLLDTVILSGAAKEEAECRSGSLDLKQQDDQLHLSVVTLGEIERE